LDDAGAKAATGDHDGLPIAAQPKKPDDNQKAQATALPKIVYMAIDNTVIDAGFAVNTETGEIINGQLNPLTVADFETLLAIKLKNKAPKAQRQLRHYYRRQYAKNGVIPQALTPDSDGKLPDHRQFAGRKRQLDDAIANRFIDMIEKSADAGDIKNYCTRAHRKVTYFHARLEKEFGKTINLQSLYTMLKGDKGKRLRDLMATTDDGVTGAIKPPSFFKAEPVGELIQMDGVESDFLEIWEGGRWVKPTWIEFFDQGSRKLLAMQAYLSESSENSVAIFTHFLQENDFPCLKMRIRPDNAGGFKNLRRPMKELNDRADIPTAFMFIDNYARAGKPKDKAHLESSHRAVHQFERFIIDHFNDAIVGQYKKRKKVGDALKTVTVTQLRISLAELNDSKIIDDYKAEHNGKAHRFTDNGIQKKWAPDDKWNEKLQQVNSFRFKPEHIELCKIYGHTKTAAKISKEGLLTYKGRKYYVEDTSLWSTHSSTPVKISRVDDYLAFFKDSDDGKYIGKAIPKKTTSTRRRK